MTSLVSGQGNFVTAQNALQNTFKVAHTRYKLFWTTFVYISPNSMTVMYSFMRSNMQAVKVL